MSQALPNQKTTTVQLDQLATLMRSKPEIYVALYEDLDLYLPPLSVCNAAFFSDIVKGNSVMLKNEGLTKKVYPKINGLDIPALEKLMRENHMGHYLPTPASKVRTPREWILNVCARVIPDQLNYMVEDLKAKSMGGMQHFADTITGNEEVIQALMRTKRISKKKNARTINAMRSQQPVKRPSKKAKEEAAKQERLQKRLRQQAEELEDKNELLQHQTQRISQLNAAVFQQDRQNSGALNTIELVQNSLTNSNSQPQATQDVIMPGQEAASVHIEGEDDFMEDVVYTEARIQE